MERCLEKVDLTDPAGVQNWHERFELYVTTNDRINDKNQTAFYLTMIGKEAYDLLKDLAYPESTRTRTVKQLQTLLMSYLRPVHFETTERAKFHNITRLGEEPLRDFLLRLQRQASKCNFGDQLTIQLRDRIVAGVNDPEIQKRLLREPGLTYDKAKSILETWDDINIAMSGQVAQVNFQERSRKPSSQPSRHGNRFQGKDKAHFSRKQYEDRPKKTNLSPCDSCGGPHKRNTCKFQKAECFVCHKLGHISKVCRSRKTSHKTAVVSSHPLHSNSSDDDCSEFQSLAVDSRSHLHHRLTFSTGKTADFIVDTGSPVSFIPFEKYKQLDILKPLSSTQQTIRGVSGHDLPVKGQTTLHVSDEKTSMPLPLNFIITERGPTVLGLDGLRALKVNVVLDVQANLSSDIMTLIHECSKNTGGIKVNPVKLEVTCDPIFRKARPVPYGLRPSIEQNLKDLAAEGILRKVETSSWATPIVTPQKADGRIRICGDFRVSINPYLKQAANTTREVEDMFQGLKGSNHFSKVDLTNAFLQVPLDEASKELATIHTSWGLYQYQFLPFGLTTSPGIFQKVIDKVIENLTGVRSYQDDIIVFGETKKEHDQRLLSLLKALQSYNVKINAKKSVFGVTSLDYLGYSIDGKGIHPNMDRVKALQNAPKPTSVKKLQSFLGFLQYYSKFVKNFAAKARPLFDLLSSDFEWSNEAERAYNDLLNSVINGEVLACFQVGKPSTLIVDASEQALGAVLEQEGRPVLCISRALSTAERNYAQTQREALAIIWAVRRLHKFLYGHKFEIVTDHQSLQHIFNPQTSVGKATSAMLQRWALDLSAYDYSIKHRPGKTIPQADYLSRFAHREPPSTDSFIVNPVPIDRNLLIKETKLAYGSVLSGLRNGWSISARKKFPSLYSKRNELTCQVDDVLQYNDRIIIPPVCREAILAHLHMGHLGRDKMKSLARLLCWWPSINEDISSFAKNCKKCSSTKTKSHPNWTPWPVTYKVMQRIHADYCGPFLGKHYALIIEDAFSKYPEVFLTTSANADFTQWALRRFFAREGVPNVIVTDNGTHFAADKLQQWLKSIGCQSVFTAPRHPRSNGLAENFVKTLKTAIAAQDPKNLNDLWQSIDAFLIQYRNANHATTGKTPSFLFHGRTVRTTANIDTTDIMFFRGNDTRPCKGLLLNQIGKKMLQVIDQEDGSLHRRHIEQVTINSDSSPTPPPPTVVNPSVPQQPLPMRNSTLPIPAELAPATDVPTAPTSLPAVPESPHPPLPLSDSPQGSPHNTPLPRRSTRSRRPPPWMADFA